MIKYNAAFKHTVPQKLQLVMLNIVAQTLVGASELEHCVPILFQLHWLLIHFWAKYRLIQCEF